MRLTRSPTALALLAALGCGPPVSLDDPQQSSSGPTTGAGPFGDVTAPPADDDTLDGPDDGVALDLGSAKLDLPPDLPLPPGACPPDCQFELTQVWAYDGPAPVPAMPLDPEDRVAVIVEPSGTILVAQERQGEVELARLSEHGQEMWTYPLPLPCDPCRVVDLGLHPAGDLLIAGHGVELTGAPLALAARVELGAPRLVWATRTPLVAGPGIAPRAGSLVASEDGALVFQPVLEGSAADGLERLEQLTYDGAGGALVLAEVLETGLGSGDAPPPRAVAAAGGTLVVTHPRWAGDASISGTVSWLAATKGEVLASAPLVEPALGLAVSPGGRVITLGQAPEARQSLLYLDSGRLREPEQWGLIHVLPTITSSMPALAVNDYGHAHVVARVAEGRPGHERNAGLEVLRWSEEGTLIWKLSLPLPLDRVDEPVGLALVPTGELVLGGFVGGARHVELRLPGCDCG